MRLRSALAKRAAARRERSPEPRRDDDATTGRPKEGLTRVVMMTLTVTSAS